MRRSLLLLAVLSAFAVGACAPAPPADGVGTPWVDQMLERINAERAAAGRSPLAFCATLQNAAQDHSQDQANTNRMSHTGSNGSTMAQRANAAGYTGWTRLAENVAAGQRSVDQVMNAWMGSSGHRANLLNVEYTHVGVGKASSGSGTLYWTQDFGRSGRC